MGVYGAVCGAPRTVARIFSCWDQDLSGPGGEDPVLIKCVLVHPAGADLPASRFTNGLSLTVPEYQLSGLPGANPGRRRQERQGLRNRKGLTVTQVWRGEAVIAMLLAAEPAPVVACS